MNNGAVLVDTGPLVALFDPSDASHEPCKKELARMENPDLVTSLAVITEASTCSPSRPKPKQACSRS